MSIVFDYFIWWYSAGFLRLLAYLKAFILILADLFSVRILVTTFFQPWKRDITPVKGLALDQRIRVWLFNLVARLFGMIIKGITFIIFLGFFGILLAVEITIFFLWLLFPAAIFVSLFWIFVSF